MEGEDLAQGNRIRKQQIQQKDWLDQQIRLKEEQDRIARENQKYVYFSIFFYYSNKP
jgi:hypothetical protein